MVVFVDTSALYALVSAKDNNYHRSVETWEKLTAQDMRLITNNYVLVECLTLLQCRLGLESVVFLQSTIIPLLEVEWLDEEQHTLAVQRILKTNRRSLSLVDCSAFETMRRLGVKTVFTFDNHFREEGFDIIP